MIEPESLRVAVVGIVMLVTSIELGMAFIMRATREVGTEGEPG